MLTTSVTPRHTTLRLVAGLGTLVLLGACGGESDGGNTGPSCTVSQVSVSPAQLTLLVGQTATLDAVVTATDCATPPAVTWQSADPAVSVTAGGTSADVTGVGPTGSPVAVSATAGGKSGSAQVSVTAPLPTTIVFAAGAGSSRELWRMDPDGGNKLRLTTNAVGDYSPTLSPDGSQIGFVRDGNLYRMSASGAGATLVATASGEVMTPAWSPDGAHFVFADFRGGFFDGKADLEVVTSSGAFVRTLLAQGRYDVAPAWSPNGTQVAFADGDSPLGCCDILRMPAAGGTPQLVFAGSGFAGTPAWSPDGTRIAFHSGFEIFIVNLTTGVVTALTPGGDGLHPTWSPDGTRIAYEGIPAGGTLADIWVMNADGSNKVNLTNTPAIDEFQPVWGLKVGAPDTPGLRALRKPYDQTAAHGARSPASDRGTRIVAGARRDAEVRGPK